MTVANGLPPSATFWRASSIVRCAKSMPAPLCLAQTVPITSGPILFADLEMGAAMARSDSDSWNLATSVGATATMVAAQRALAAAGPEPLIDDPYAAALVRAVGIDVYTRLVDGKIPVAEGHEF